MVAYTKPQQGKKEGLEESQEGLEEDNCALEESEMKPGVMNR